MAAIIKDMKELNAEEVADTFKIIIPKIEKGEMKFFIIIHNANHTDITSLKTQSAKICQT